MAAGGTSLVATSSAAAVSQSAKTIGLVLALKWMTLGAGAGVVTATGLQLLADAPAEDSRTIGDRAKSAGIRRGASAAGPPRPSVTEARIAPQTAHSSGSAAPGPGAAQSRAAKSPHIAPLDNDAIPSGRTLIAPSLSEEVDRIERARHALAAGNPAAALAVLDEYERSFDNGNLAPEATVLRIQALIEQREVERGAELARQFLAHNPHSPHAARVRTLLSRSKP
jgi:hypothetical protein